MKHRIENIQGKKFIGCHATMSLARNTTADLWRSFMPRREEILNPVGSNLYSMQVYAPKYFERFNPETEFEKWALTEVSSFEHLPAGMVSMSISGGLYAVFEHKGPASKGAESFGYIFGTWLPGSGYELDNRPHFEVLGDLYKNDDPGSEEEIWIPVRIKD